MNDEEYRAYREAYRREIEAGNKSLGSVNGPLIRDIVNSPVELDPAEDTGLERARRLSAWRTPEPEPALPEERGGKITDHIPGYFTG